MRILVACGAGASSTFVAMRVRRAAASRDLDVTAKAVTVEDIASRLDSADVLLLGAHLAAQAHDLEALAQQAGVGFAIMPENVFSSPTGDEALDLALDVAGAGR
ncbi:PTS sugar transporter subunit IIB [Paramicrobacterium sp. CJ85]|uniref:PTS sugar transporter subunit IIB n=1 Tax=Paramicrobacterium sp. CJ85 TaxID=3445355 RepID=UPI003F61CD10